MNDRILLKRLDVLMKAVGTNELEYIITLSIEYFTIYMRKRKKIILSDLLKFSGRVNNYVSETF